MAVEVKPVGVKCNIQCQYCYQNPIRDAGNLAPPYDLDRIKAALEAEGGMFNLFGGEPLLMKRADLEDLWAWGLARFGRNGVQTNGTLIDADLVRMFKQYRVRVGLSLDGPGELNDARWCGSLEATREQTAKAENAVAWLCREGMPPALIVTLSRKNAAPALLPRLFAWVRSLDELGVRKLRLHILESESDVIREHYGLSADENVQALLGFAALEKELHRLRFDLFGDMRNMLRGRDNHSTCIWMGCDSYTTRAVAGIEGNGQKSNCGRTNKDGIDYVKAEGEGFERYLALYFTPQEAGGCAGCRFFLMCKGQCPGTSIGGDWRNRSEHCEVWKSVYAALEAEMMAAGRTPLSRSRRRHELERSFIAAWLRRENPTMRHLLRPRTA